MVRPLKHHERRVRHLLFHFVRVADRRIEVEVSPYEQCLLLYGRHEMLKVLIDRHDEALLHHRARVSVVLRSLLAHPVVDDLREHRVHRFAGEEVSLDDYKKIVKKDIDNTQRVRINNILVSEDWAAIHFWTVTTNDDGTKTADNHMQFLHFVQNGDKVQVDRCFMK